MTDRAKISRRQKTGENAVGEPLYERAPVDVDVECAFDGESTSFVREQSGERVRRPATATFPHDADVEEGDHVDVEGVEPTYEVVGTHETRDRRRGLVVSINAELEVVE